MPIYGRPDVPGEDSPNSLMNRRILDRTILGQIQTGGVDSANGTMKVDFPGATFGGRVMTIHPLWFSFPFNNNGPAWGRYMPQESDIVRVAFDYNDQPVAVGYDLVDGNPSVGNGLVGWPTINKLHADVISNRNTEPGFAKFASFIQLKPGEYDFMSSGGAYIHGTDKGRLNLSGGTVSISLTKNDLRMDMRNKIGVWICDDSSIRMGQVRRVNPVTQLEEKLQTDANGAYKEFLVNIKSSSVLSIAKFHIGNIVDDSQMSLAMHSSGSPRRAQLVVYNDGGQSAYDMSVDSMGNCDIIAQNATQGLVTKFPKTKFNSAQAGTQILLEDNKVHLGGTDTDSPTESLILGNTYRRDEDSMLTDIGTAASQAATMLNIAGTFLLTAATSNAVPVTGGASALPAFTTVSTNLQSAATELIKIQTAITSFKARAQSFLSTTVKTK